MAVMAMGAGDTRLTVLAPCCFWGKRDKQNGQDNAKWRDELSME